MLALAVSILAFSAALTLCNISGAPPPRASASVRLALGFAAVLGGTLAALWAVPPNDPGLVPISLIVFTAAILVEQLLGAAIRSRMPALFGGRPPQ